MVDDSNLPDTHYKFTEILKQQFDNEKKYKNFIDKFINQANNSLEVLLDKNIFPEIKYIANHQNHNICYHGRECSAFEITIYEWNPIILCILIIQKVVTQMY